MTAGSLPSTMAAVLLTGHGGFDRLQHRTDVAVPLPGPGDVVVRVRACGLNNTDVNTRTGWYASEVRSATDPDAGDQVESGGWGGSLPFPLIQGADVCGEVAAVGDGVDDALVGRRVLVDPWILDGDDPGDLTAARYVGSEVDGGFAEFCAVPATNAHPIESPLSDAELATFPCASSTAEHLLAEAAVGAGDVVALTGASGGVGTAVVQLAVARGAQVVAVASAAKRAALLELGAAAVVDRDDPVLGASVLAASPTGVVDAVIDVVGGAMFAQLVPVIRAGGHYAAAGAIAGPIVELDLRHLIYGDLHMAGATVCPPGTFARVVEQIEAGVLRPVLAATYPLADLVEAQRAFVDKRHVGNIVVVME